MKFLDGLAGGKRSLLRGFKQLNSCINSHFIKCIKYLKLLALRVPQLLQVVIKSQFGELVLEVNSKIHVFHRVHHDINKLHTSRLQTGVQL